MPPVAYSEEEPRYVNAAQFKRMMIMRIKRAARDLKMNKAAETIRPPTNTEGPDSSSKVFSKIDKYLLFIFSQQLLINVVEEV